MDILFEVLDHNHDGRIDGLELLGGLTLICQGEFEEKARFCFELYDFQMNGSMSKSEMIMMFMASIGGVSILVGAEGELPKLEVLESLVNDLFNRIDRDNNGCVSYDEFVSWARSNRELMAGLEVLNKVASEAKNDIPSDDSADDADEGALSDFDNANTNNINSDALLLSDSKVKIKEMNVSSKFINDINAEFINVDDSHVQWLNHSHEPTDYRVSRRINEGPDTNLELEWAFGYRTTTSRDNLRYVESESDPNTTRFVYSTASLAVIQNIQSKEQQFYQGHSHEITCIALHPNSLIVATGDMSSFIHLWNVKTFACSCIIRGLIKEGVQLLQFSYSGDRIVSIGRDNARTIEIYDCATGELLSSAKGITYPNNVLDLSFSKSGAEIAVVGKKEVRFYKGANTGSRTLDCVIGKIGKGNKKQTFFCVTHMGEDAIVGCASGELYRFRGDKCIQTIQAHGLQEPVLCIYHSEKDGIIVTGGKDCIVKSWDSTLKEVGMSLDLSEDLYGLSPSTNSAITSVSCVRNRILVGTRGCDIYEVVLPKGPGDSYSLNRVARGHAGTDVCALAIHPVRAEFATSGTDKTIRLWSIRSHEQINMRILPSTAKSLCFNPSGALLAVGMEDGSVFLVDVMSDILRAFATWKHCSEQISEIKFSPNGLFMAVGCYDSNIYLYKSTDKLNFSRHAICRGHSGPISHIDFSVTSQVLRSNCKDKKLYFWDTLGSMISTSTTLRDVTWASLTGVYGWHTQGVWPKETDYLEYNCAEAVPDIGSIVTGDKSGLIKIFRYPSLVQGALSQCYVGHSSPVNCVRYSANRRHVVSIGSSDGTILLWKHEVEAVASSGEEGGNSSSSSSASSSSDGEGNENFEFTAESNKKRIKSIFQEAINNNQSLQEIFSAVAAEFQLQEEMLESEPWKKEVVGPATQEVTGSSTTTDVGLNLQWIHGFRSEGRNNVLYSAKGNIVYTSASVAIIYSKIAGKQNFFQRTHRDDIISIAGHPSGQIFATGEVGRKPIVVIWNAGDLRVLNKIEGVHKYGVPHLAFNSTGNLLASVGGDSNQTLSLHDWLHGIEIMRTPTDKGKVHCLCFLVKENQSNVSTDVASDIIVTGGEKHLKFWWSKGQNIKSQKGIWGANRRDTILCVASGSPSICVSASRRGNILIWKDFKAVSDCKKEYNKINNNDIETEGEYPHKSSIQALWAIPGEITKDVHQISQLFKNLSTSARYVTGDRKGVVAVWRLIENTDKNLKLKCVSFFNMTSLSPQPFDVSVKSISEQDGSLLISTGGSEIYEVAADSIPLLPLIEKKTKDDSTVDKVSVNITSNRVVCGHYGAELWALATHPKVPVYFTAGDDRTLRCWSLTEHKLLSFTTLPEKCRAIDILPTDGCKSIALALNSGIVWIVSAEKLLNPHLKMMTYVDTSLNSEKISLNSIRVDAAVSSTAPESSSHQISPEVKIIKDGGTQWIQEIKYSFDGSLLAVASHDKSIYLYDVRNDYAPLPKLNGHHSHVTHIDFGIILNVTEESKESFDEVKQVIKKVTSVRDEETKEIKTVTEERKIERSDICIQSTSGTHELFFWSVHNSSRIFQPSIVKDAWWATWTSPYGWPVQGIWSEKRDGTNVTSVARSHTWKQVPTIGVADNFGRVRLFNYPCVNIGAPDKCYKGHSNNITNIRFSYDDAYCLSIGGDDKSVFVWATDILDEIREREVLKSVTSSASVKPKISSEPHLEDEEESFSQVLKPPTGGDEALAVLPWKGAIREPSDWKEPPNLGDAPDHSLVLSFVYGYRGWDCRNNLDFVTNSFRIAYHIAAVGIVYNSQDNTQVHNLDHDDDILCLAVHPAGHSIATGEIGPKPKIIIWDANTGVTVRTIMYHTKGVSHLTFSGSGNLLISIGMDQDRIIAVHNSKTGVLVGTGKAGKGIDVHSISAHGDVGFLTAGKNLVKFWDLPTGPTAVGELASKAGMYHKSVEARVVVSTAYMGTDAITGMSDGTLLLWKDRTNTKFVSKAHKGPITSLYSVIDTASPALGVGDGNNGPHVISGGKDGFVYIWSAQLSKVWTLDLNLTQPVSICPQIQSLATKDGKILIGTKGSEIYEINVLNPAETFRWMQGHSDERSELWGLDVHPKGSKFVTAGDDMTVRVWDMKGRQQLHIANMNSKIRSVAFNFDGSNIAVATFEGRIKVLSSDLQTLVVDVGCASKWIQSMKYSPNGSVLAVGSHDTTIYLLDTKTYSVQQKCKGHHSFITGLDFSADGKYLQSTSGDYELLFWDTSNGKQILSATSLRDVTWHTFSCPLGWPVQGIWPPDSNGTDVNSVDRSPDGKLLVTGDDFRRVKIFAYPCPKEKSKFKESKGHAEHVMTVKFTSDGKNVISVGGLDKAILQYNLK